MINERDVKICEGFHEQLAHCIESGMASGAMYRHLSNCFPHAELPASVDSINGWLKKSDMWQKFLAILGRERTELLWEINCVRTRSSRRETSQPTLDDMLEIPATA